MICTASLSLQRRNVTELTPPTAATAHTALLTKSQKKTNNIPSVITKWKKIKMFPQLKNKVVRVMKFNFQFSLF